jgi:hypothetical protein
VPQYPPPPAAWGSSKGALTEPELDPARARHVLYAWAQQRGYQVNEQPQVDWYRSWGPFVHVPVPTQARREIIAQFGDAKVWLLDALAPSRQNDPTLRPFIVSFVTSPQIRCRVAIRSRIPESAIQEMRVPFNPNITPSTASRWRSQRKEKLQHRTYGKSVGSSIGDPVFEAQFQVVTPSRAEGLAGLPRHLRRFLVDGCWQGAMETRPGGMIVSQYRPPRFDPDALDVSLWLLGQIFHAAVTPDADASGSVRVQEMYGPNSNDPKSGR